MSTQLVDAKVALRLAVDLIEQAADEAGPLGIDGGIVYLALGQHGMRVEDYERILDAMVRLERIDVRFGRIYLKGSTE